MKRFHITGRHTVIALALGGCATDPPEKLAVTDQDTDLSAAESRACAECGALSPHHPNGASPGLRTATQSGLAEFPPRQ